MTQRESNPYKNSDSNKRYYTFDYFCRRKFGKRCAKIPLDCGLTCPNIDGTVGTDGCIYCLGGSCNTPQMSLSQQYRYGAESLRTKWHEFATIPYLQAHTNTYAPLCRLEEIYREAASFEGAVMLAVATRADCLPQETVELLACVSKTLPVLVELGLQTSNDITAEKINRGHTVKDFEDGYFRLKNAGGNILTCVHIINGLPGETHSDMMNTAKYVASLSPDMVKIHLLHILKGTKLCDMYNDGKYLPMERDEYISATVDQIEVMPEDTVIARLTGDGMADSLVAPLWSKRKVTVINDIDKELYRRNSYQGMKYT